MAKTAQGPKSTKKAPGRKAQSAKKASPKAKRASSVGKADVVEAEIVEMADDLEEAGIESTPRFSPEDAERAYELAKAGVSDIDPDVDDVAAPAPPKTVNVEIVDPDERDSRALATVDPIAMYLAEIRKYPLLSKEQERELAMRYRETGDPKAAEMLVTSNLRFVVKVAAEYSRFGAKLIDLIQEGNVGLMHAVREFNPYKGVRLITYAVWWIRGYIQEYLMRQYSMVRIGTTQNQRKPFYRLQKVKEKLEAAGVEPSVALLSGRLGVSEEEVETMQKRMSGRDISLNQPLDSGASAATLLDFEPAPDVAIDESIGSREELELLKEHLEAIRPTLNDREIQLLDRRLLADDPETLQEIGDEWGVTREAVRQLEARLIAKIRKAVAADLGADIDSD